MKNIFNTYLSIEEFIEISSKNLSLQIDDETHEKIARNRTFLEESLKNDKPIYGINTGFGSLYDRKINVKEIERLQENLVLSHACGMGEHLPEHLSKTIHALKIRNLSLGNSGVRSELVEVLIKYYNEGIYPVIYELGSLGASGDLAPLAHLGAMLLGQGKVWYQGKIENISQVQDRLGIQPFVLKSKEGLAILNGTQFCTGIGLHIITEAKKIAVWADVIASMSMVAFNCQLSPLHQRVQEIRPHQGQKLVASRIRSLLEKSNLADKEGKAVQDPYSFRCVPQVHGATLDTIHYVSSVLEIELNSVTDNPNIFDDLEEIVSAGNFHAQPIALVMDFLCISLSEYANISERRTYQLTTGKQGLPTYLIENPGLNSGIMIMQYTAASIVSQNKQYCTPASVDSIVSSLGQEDHVSMGANAATKCLKVKNNVQRVLAIELFAAMQGIEFIMKDTVLSPILQQVYDAYRRKIPPLKQDRMLYNDMQKSLAFIQNFDIFTLIDQLKVKDD